MKIKFYKGMICMLAALIINPGTVNAVEGYSGYEGGISSGEVVGKTTYEYQEVNFLSGQPLVFKGNLTIKKSLKGESITSTYTYDLSNVDKGATLKRTLIYNTKLSKKDNGQSVEETSISGKPVESVKIGNSTYTLTGYDFSRTNLTDLKPAVNYYAGNISGRKAYSVGNGSGSASQGSGTITVDITGKFYGYDQYWGTTEVEEINYIIQSEKKNGMKVERWGGTADITFSTSTTKQIRYIENKPNEISFEGGYVQTQSNSSILEYTSKLPSFSAGNVPSDNMITSKDSLKIETFPVQTRLKVPDLSQLKGHWSENDVRTLYSLEVLTDNEKNFNPEQFMKRSEFAKAIILAGKEVPIDSSIAPKTTAQTSKKNTQIFPTFNDVSLDHQYFNQIESSFKRGFLNGKGEGNFKPDDYLTLAEAVTVFIRGLGLEAMAPKFGAVTTFKDNDLIPAYAKNAIRVAEQIGLVKGDEKGYLNPSSKLTNAKAAALLNRFIVYMRDGIRKDYRDKYLGF
ncbi:MAG TPA: S-layer homology domain-containing protein [Pseudobacteroides sp.]|uniref:S-layer homology domain-containing protein n=1 Tax=Pseudobacteroides sp. TaxID=1968840 RepID=UPI002F93A619